MSYFLVNEGFDNKIFVFATVDACEVLKTVLTYCSDGILKIIPNVFEQTYTIHANLSETTHDLLLILLLITHAKSETVNLHSTLQSSKGEIGY